MTFGLSSQRWSLRAMMVAGIGIAAAFTLIARWVPIPSPTDSAGEVASMYGRDTLAIQVTVVLFAMLWTVWIPFSAVIAAHLSRREAGFPFWSVVSFGGGLLLTMIVILAALLWGAASFRPDRAPEITQALNDLGWILFVMPAGPLGAQILATGLVALGDRGTDPPFPRWYGFLSLWMFTVTMPGFVIVIFKTGPLAWNGLLGIWVPLVGVGAWAATTIVLLLRAIKVQQDEQQRAVAQEVSADVAVPAA